MSKSTQEELFARLNPDADYGDRTFAMVQQELKDGDLLLRDSPNDQRQPIIVEAKGQQKLIKGTASTAHAGLSGASHKLTNRLIKFINEEDGDELVIATLTEALKGGKDSHGDKIPWKQRMDAVELTFERVIGRVHERRTSSENKLLDALLRRMQLGELDEEREVPQLPEYTTNEVEAG